MCSMNCIKWGAENLSEEEVKGKRVIEVGSYDVNGSLRYIVTLLKPAEYVGVDIVQGPGVDVICPAEDLVQEFGTESFDVVISTCTLEHIRNWQMAISNIKNVCKPNGIILLIVPSVCHYHEYPGDFWRYSKDDMQELWHDCNILVMEEDPQPPSMIYAKIAKPQEFTEKDLSDYELHSVIVNKRTREIHDRDLRSAYFRYLVFRSKIRDTIVKVGKTVLSRN